MDIEQAKKIVIKVVSSVLDNKELVTEDMQLLGSDSTLDSVKLVEVCLELEDLASDYGFEFDWTSETTMSKSRSMFRSITTLAEEFLNQSEI